ncbi:uncharacterized protein LOC106063755 [Biomphalaria glabrata]|uniref:Uncharacterized protein LOC106063755 n=1 Tax=Biomphalaria glabrata TaxID=6526 RepID=A0A9U8E8V1_BIOGL|nr:uncharacterized protein LOC106063755 [Biomphalaria glabrata]
MATVLDNKRCKSPLFENGDLSKDFGLDITVFQGGTVKSSVSQQQYQAVCSNIYDQFTMTLAEHIKEELKLRQLLKTSQTPRIEATAVSASTPHTNTARDAEFGDTDEAKDYAADAKDVTKYSRGILQDRATQSKQQKITRGSDSLRKEELSLPRRQYKEYDGRIEPSSLNLSKNRVIRVNAKTFSRLTRGQIRAQLLNANEEYILTPFIGSSLENNDRERLVVAKQRTTYKTPTLASELKVNNLVAIQRDILGQGRRRRSVREVLTQARDRRARLYRVQLTNYKFCDDLQFKVADETKRDRAGRDDDSEVTPRSQTLQHKQQLQRLRPPRRTSFSSASDLLDISSRTTPEVDDVKNDVTVLDVTSDLTSSANEVTETRNISHKKLDLSKNSKLCSKPVMERNSDEDQISSSLKKVCISGKTLNKINPDTIFSSINKTQDRSVSTPGNPESVVLSTSENLSRLFTPIKENPDMTQTSSQTNPAKIDKFKSSKVSRAKCKLVRSAPMSSNFNDPINAGNSLRAARSLHTMHDVRSVVKQWKEEDRNREEKLNLWRKRMTFITVRRREMAVGSPLKEKL